MVLREDEITHIKAIINAALNEVYEHDRYLIEHKIHERSIVARFVIYFHEQLKNTHYSHYHLDVEYNRNFSDPKRTPSFSDGTYPDVIVHRRGSNKENLCILEFKTQWNQNTDRDITKLKEFTEKRGTYQYGAGFMIVIGNNAPEIQTVINGELQSKLF